MFFAAPNLALAKNKCQDQADQVLEEIEIEGHFVKLKIAKDPKSTRKERAYRFWYRTPQCEYGYVVVRSIPHTCEVREVYTSNGCRIDGLDSWFYWLKE